MKDYKNMNDFEINKEVFFKAGFDYQDCIATNSKGSSVHYGDGANWYEFNPCNNIVDAWPLITDNNICIHNDKRVGGNYANTFTNYGYVVEHDHMFEINTDKELLLSRTGSYEQAWREGMVKIVVKGDERFKGFSFEQDEDGDKDYGNCCAPVQAWVVDDLNNEISIYDTYAKTCESYKKIKENKK